MRISVHQNSGITRRFTNRGASWKPQGPHKPAKAGTVEGASCYKAHTGLGSLVSAGSSKKRHGRPMRTKIQCKHLLGLMKHIRFSRGSVAVTGQPPSRQSCKVQVEHMSVKAHADNHLALLSNLSNLYETACSRQLHRLDFSGSHPQSLQSMAPEAYIFCLVYGYRNSIIKKTNMMFNVGGITINTSASLVNGLIFPKRH